MTEQISHASHCIRESICLKWFPTVPVQIHPLCSPPPWVRMNLVSWFKWTGTQHKWWDVPSDIRLSRAWLSSWLFLCWLIHFISEGSQFPSYKLSYVEREVHRAEIGITSGWQAEGEAHVSELGSGSFPVEPPYETPALAGNERG